MKNALKFIVLFILLPIVSIGCVDTGKRKLLSNSYFFDRPAKIWEETLPLGNGRIGLMPDGGVDKETIILNEISMWSGRKQNTDNEAAAYYLPQIRNLLFQGQHKEAQEMMYRHFVCGGQGSAHGNGANAPYGSFQLLGNLELTYHYGEAAKEEKAYRRELNLQDAIASVAFQKDGVNYFREAFTSFSNDLGVVYLKADVDKMINFSLTLNRPERDSVWTDGLDLFMQGQLNDGDNGEQGVRYGAQVKINLPKGGQLQTSGKDLIIKDASEVVILVGMATDYFGQGVDEQLQQLLENSTRYTYDELRGNHVAKYRELYDRVEVDFGQTDNALLPINERLYAFNRGEEDPGLMSLYFQFGRYLLISSTRPGLLPPNLQGLWAQAIQAPWNGDYHLNINLQMNLWPAEVTNLSELHMPLIEWTKSQVKSGENTARVFYKAGGWVTHILGNVWEFTAPGEHPSWGATNTSAAWLCQHLYEHYLFTQDTTYLKDVYPVLKGASLFFTDMLVEDPRSKYLVTAPTTSPENGYVTPNGDVVNICAGSTMDNQLVRELFTNTIQTAEQLGVDADFVSILKEKRARLMPTTIGPDGRIMEWLEPYKEVEPHHRHVSHLYGLYPGYEISAEHTPELAEAARESLIARGDVSTGWSMAWKVNFWARLRDGEHAYKLLSDLLRPCVDSLTLKTIGGGTYPNLFCAHPPFQIDGNFGGCAGIAEMLLQSQSDCVELLPALPQAWNTGLFKGLKVRGGGEVSAKWKEGQLLSASLKNVTNTTREYRVKLPEDNAKLRLRVDNQPLSLPVVDGIITIELHSGQEANMMFN